MRNHCATARAQWPKRNCTVVFVPTQHNVDILYIQIIYTRRSLVELKRSRDAVQLLLARVLLIVMLLLLPLFLYCFVQPGQQHQLLRLVSIAPFSRIANTNTLN